jgi:TatD DNase family protein
LKLFDVHTHLLKDKPDTNAVLNVFWQDLNILPENQPFSLSAHPWHLDTYNSVEFEHKLQALMDNPLFMAVGECGLDKNTAFNPDFQISVLNEQYKFAEKSGRPMVIHCVRSFELLLQWQKGKHVKMLVHGFNRKIELLSELIKAGFYLSFGAALFEDKTSLNEALAECLPDRLFLETDDQEKYSIEDIYTKAASILKIDVDKLQLQILENNKIFFKQ